MAGTLADTIRGVFGRLTTHERAVVLTLHGIDVDAPDAFERLLESLTVIALRNRAEQERRKAAEAK